MKPVSITGKQRYIGRYDRRTVLSPILNGYLYVKSTDGSDAPGYRSDASGEPVSVGYYGFSRSSATNGIRGLDLNFGSQRLSADYADSRAHSFQLRCLSHPQGVLLAASALTTGHLPYSSTRSLFAHGTKKPGAWPG